MPPDMLIRQRNAVKTNRVRNEKKETKRGNPHATTLCAIPGPENLAPAPSRRITTTSHINFVSSSQLNEQKKSAKAPNFC
jgi:hypothetical protein